MSTTLSNFLTKVAIEPKASIEFNKNPVHTINTSALSEVNKTVLLTKNPGSIRDAILKEKGVSPSSGLNAAGDTEVVLVIVI